MEFFHEGSSATVIDEPRAGQLLDALLIQLRARGPLRRVLILPPDVTRYHSWAGPLTRLLYERLRETAELAILPATGTHLAMTDEEIARMFPGVPRALFHEHEFTAREIFRRLRQQNGYLNRKHVLAINVLVKAVVVTCLILKQQWRRLGLAHFVATCNEFGVVFRIARFDTHRSIPSVRNRYKARVECGTKFANDLWQWVVEIFVFAAAKAMPRHNNATAEDLILRIQVCDCAAFPRNENAFENGATVTVELL